MELLGQHYKLGVPRLSSAHHIFDSIRDILGVVLAKLQARENW